MVVFDSNLSVCLSTFLNAWLGSSRAVGYELAFFFFFFDKKMKIYVSVLSRSCFSLKHNDL